jgi:hypothetical protein
VNALPAVLPADPIAIPAGSAAVHAAPLGIRNPETVGVLLDKIVFADTGGAAPISVYSFSLKQDNEPITNGLVSAAAVCYPRNRLVERDGVFVLHLAKPIYLAPKAHLDVAVQADLQVPTDDRVISAVGIGRQTPAPPRERWLPYVSNYRGATVDFSQPAGTPFTDTVQGGVLGNPFNYPVSVERVIAAVLVGEDPADLRLGDPQRLWGKYRARISDQHEKFWASRPVSILSLTDQNDRSWPVGITLGAHEGLTLDVEGETTGEVRFAQLHVGLVAYRRIY